MSITTISTSTQFYTTPSFPFPSLSEFWPIPSPS